MSALSAWMFSAVSRSVSPFCVEELAASKAMTSALSLFAAMSKAIRVRVLGSRKRLTIVLPRRAGTFFTLRRRIFLNAADVAWICSISARLSSSMESRCRRVQVIGPRRRAAPLPRTGGCRSGRGRDRPGARPRRPRPSRRRWRCPTKSAATGRRRLPRSTSTASSTVAGRPWSKSSSSAALTVRPVKRTSSTRRTSAPLTSPGRSVGVNSLGIGCLPDVVPVERDVEVADPPDPEAGAQAAGERDAPVRDPEHQQALGARVPGPNGRREPLYGGVNLPGADGLGRGHCGKYCMPVELR